MPNRLANETSPYLQQHADNPVNWYPWGEEALKASRAQNKPILLSIGYSACHWCHVMAHESFEDEETAQLMNELFVNIKVDREERPDLDQIYQSAQQMITQRSGGWPLTLFLTPDQIPFFGGTYFPKTARYNLPGFKDLLPQVADFYRKNQEGISENSGSIIAAFESSLPETQENSDFTRAALDRARLQLAQSFDARHGGFGAAPKFPHPENIEFLLRHFYSNHDRTALDMALHSLQKMGEGGIYDQLGGGFCRYSTDEQWLIPHFEKMLYDNGPLLYLAADAYLAGGQQRFAQVAGETAQWVMHEMQSPQGGYYSTLDADSEHVEGKFYVWTREQASALLSATEYAVIAAHYGLEGPANFEHEFWHFHIAQPLDQLAQRIGIGIEEARQHLATARSKLFIARQQRVHPGRDEKILTSWNGLMIKGMAHAGRALESAPWVDSALRAADFVRTVLWRDERLLATCKEDKAHLNAYLDDYAFMLDALLELLQAE
ncbi:MAG: thioredoxin domain-containing protein, partial [Burkholderiales bacterium]